MKNKVEEILNNLIRDFNCKWQSGDELNCGISEYANKIVEFFSTSNNTNYQGYQEYKAFIWFYKKGADDIKAEIIHITNKHQEDDVRSKPETIELRLL
jgi:hypothetical protein